MIDYIKYGMINEYNRICVIFTRCDESQWAGNPANRLKCDRFGCSTQPLSIDFWIATFCAGGGKYWPVWSVKFQSILTTLCNAGISACNMFQSVVGLFLSRCDSCGVSRAVCRWEMLAVVYDYFVIDISLWLCWFVACSVSQWFFAVVVAIM